jgi:hypothetical protein
VEFGKPGLQGADLTMGELQPQRTSIPDEFGTVREKLESWKEIASFFKREVRTVQLWERHEGLPVHRHHHRRSATVHAYRAELLQWWQRRCSVREDTGSPSKSAPPSESSAALRIVDSNTSPPNDSSNRNPRSPRWQ